MFRHAAWIAGGFFSSVAAVLAGSLIGKVEFPARTESFFRTAAAQQTAVNRAGKGDRLPFAAAADSLQEQKRVSVVEVIGVRDAAIAYRDRAGNVLFRTDPMSNVTVVVKNLVLPEVTVRETARSSVDRVPLDAPRPTVTPPTEPAGCEPAVSPLQSPQRPPIIGRCLSDSGTRAKYSAAQ